MVKRKIIIASIFLSCAILFLIVASTFSSAQYYLTVDELLTQRQYYQGKEVKISGKVLGSSILYDQDTHRLTFVITSEDKSKNLNTSYPKDTLKVYYQGIKPDLLNNDVLVIASGHLIGDDVFQADELLFKCPSKYEGYSK